MMRASYHFTKEAVERAGLASRLLVQSCAAADVPQALLDAHVAVPLMLRLDAPLLRSAKQLQMIVQFGVGLEGVDIQTVRLVGAQHSQMADASNTYKYSVVHYKHVCHAWVHAPNVHPAMSPCAQASEEGIAVSNIPSAGTGNAASCAEHAIFLTLALLRNFRGCQSALAAQKLGEPCGETLLGKHVLVLGFGGIANELIPRLQPFGVQISCVRRSAWSAEVRTSADHAELGSCSSVHDRLLTMLTPVWCPPLACEHAGESRREIRKSTVCSTSAASTCTYCAGPSGAASARAPRRVDRLASNAATCRHRHRCCLARCCKPWAGQQRLPAALQVCLTSCTPLSGSTAH